MADDDVKIENPLEEDAAANELEVASDHADEMKRAGLTPSVGAKPKDGEEKKPEAAKPAEPVKPAEKPEEKEPKAPAKGAGDKPADEKSEDGGDEDKGETKKPEAGEPVRPLKYIPVPVFQKEKEARKTAEAALKVATDKLTAIEAGKGPDKPADVVAHEKEALETEIRTIAEGLGADEAAVQKLITLASKGQLTAEERTKFAEVIKAVDEKKAEDADKAKAEAAATAETAHYEKEWAIVLPDLTKANPTATEKQLAEAKAKLNEIAYSDEFYRFPIDYVVFKLEKDPSYAGDNKGILSKILTNPKKPSAEGGALGKNQPTQKGAKTKVDYSTMTPAKAAQIEQEMAAGGDEPLVLTRDGQQVPG